MEVTKYDDMEQFERLLRSYLQRLVAMVSLTVDLTSTLNCFSGSILILGIPQDIYISYTTKLEFAVSLLCVFRDIYHKKREIPLF